MNPWTAVQKCMSRLNVCLASNKELEAASVVVLNKLISVTLASIMQLGLLICLSLIKFGLHHLLDLARYRHHYILL